MLKLIGLFVVTAGLDRLFAHAVAVPGVVLADPVTVIAVAATVTAATAVTTGTLNYIASQQAADAQRSLENQQASALKAQSDAAAQEAAAQAVSGQTFGKSDDTTRAISTGLGFGTGTAPAPNSGGRSQLTGMG